MDIVSAEELGYLFALLELNAGLAGTTTSRSARFIDGEDARTFVRRPGENWEMKAVDASSRLNGGVMSCSSNTPSSFVTTTPFERGTHQGVVCDGCFEENIGTRFKCATCDDFNMCIRCDLDTHTHDTWRISEARVIIREVQCKKEEPEEAAAEETSVPVPAKPTGEAVFQRARQEALAGVNARGPWDVAGEALVPKVKWEKSEVTATSASYFRGKTVVIGESELKRDQQV